jgi:hypothetical protein
MDSIYHIRMEKFTQRVTLDGRDNAVAAPLANALSAPRLVAQRALWDAVPRMFRGLYAR